MGRIVEDALPRRHVLRVALVVAAVAANQSITRRRQAIDDLAEDLERYYGDPWRCIAAHLIRERGR